MSTHNQSASKRGQHEILRLARLCLIYVTFGLCGCSNSDRVEPLSESVVTPQSADVKLIAQVSATGKKMPQPPQVQVSKKVPEPKKLAEPKQAPEPKKLAEPKQAPETKKEADKTATTLAKPDVRDFWADEDPFFPERRVVATYVDDKPHGEARFFDGNWRLICLDHYQDGVLHGARIMYYPSGNKYGVTLFKNGKADGMSKVWFENGNLAETFEYSNGVFHGETITYYPNGKAMVVAKLVDGVKQGERYHYLPDGQMFATSYWENNQQIGQNVLFELTRAQYESTRGRIAPGVLKGHWK